MKVRESSFASGAGVRALLCGRVGFAFCEEEARLPETIGKAEASSSFSVESGFSFAPQARMPEAMAPDPSLDPSDIEGLGSMVDSMVEGGSAHGARVKAVLTVRRSTTSIENTAGLSASYAKSAYTAYVEAMHDDGFGFAYSSGITMPPDLRALGLKAAQMAKDMRGALKIPGGDYTVVIRPEAMDSLLDVFLPSLSGDWVRRGISRLAGKDLRFDSRLTIADDPLAPATAYRPFDDEGTPSERRPLIEDGKVASFMYDRECAALSGADGGGFCDRAAYDSAPGIGQSNLRISPGDMGDFDSLGKRLEVYSMHGSHTANATSGDAGFEISTAFLVEEGLRTPVRGLMMSCNVFDMFSDIEAIGKEVRTLGSLIAPLIAFKDVRIVS